MAVKQIRAPGTDRKGPQWEALAKQRLALGRQRAEPCCRCGAVVDYTLTGMHPSGPTVDHLDPVALTGQLIVPLNRLGIAHRLCNTRHGQNVRKEIQKKKAALQNNADSGITQNAPILRDPASPPGPSPANDMPPIYRPMAFHSDGFVLPRIETPIRPGTSYEFADSVLAWIDANAPGYPLLPWQRYVIRRGFEVANNRLWRQVAFLVSRQQGKTYLMQRICLARMRATDLFGPRASVLNTHQDNRQAQELLESITRDGQLGGYLRSRNNGADWWGDADGFQDVGHGRVWRARAQTRSAITGIGGISFAFVDELQDAKADVISRTVRPILSGARLENPQVWFAGTGERANSAVLRQIRDAGAMGTDTLWLEWSAPPGVETRDHEAWKWASPDWSDGREEALASDVNNMSEEDFRSEYLVQHIPPVMGGWLAEWPGLGRPPGSLGGLGTPEAVAVECEPGTHTPAIVAAYTVGEGIYIRSRRAGSFSLAAAIVADLGARSVVLGKSLAHDPAMAALMPEVRGNTASESVARFQSLVREGIVSHDGGPLLAEQIAAVEIDRGLAGQVRLVSVAPIDAIKAAVWAIDAARSAPEAPGIY